MADDEFESADADTMEPESPTGADPAPDFSDDVEEVVSARGRNVTSKTRELFAKAAQDLKAQRVASDVDDEFEYDEGYTPPAERPGPAAASAPAAAPSPTVADSATVPPAPSLDPGVAELRNKLEARQSELAERERKLAEREAASDFEKFRDAYTERGHGAIVDLIKSWAGTMTDEELQNEVADLITGLSGDVLKVPIPADMRSQIEARRALKTVKAHTAKLTKREAEIDARRAAADEAATEQRAVAALSNELAQDAHRKAYPFLSAEDDAAGIVFDVIKTQHKRDGTMLAWTDAAKKANEYLEKKWRAEHGKRAHLLSQQANAAESAATEQRRAQGEQQGGIRSSRTLSNAQTSAASTPPAKPRDAAEDGKWTPERHRAETKRKFRAAFSRPDE